MNRRAFALTILIVNLAIVLKLTAKLSNFQGQLLDSLTKEPLSRIIFYVRDSQKTSTGLTDSLGFFSLAGRTDDSTLTIKIFGYQPAILSSSHNNTIQQINLVPIPFSISPQVITAGRDAIDRHQLPLSILSIDSTALSRLGAVPASLALRLKGFYIRDYGSEGNLNTLHIRGFRGTDIAVYLDDIQLYNPQNGSADLSLIGAVPLENIQIAQAGASSILGPGAVNAAIFFQTAMDQRAQFELCAGSYGYYQASFNSAYKPVPRWKTAISIDATRSEGDFKYQLSDYHLTRYRKNNDSQHYKIYWRNQFNFDSSAPLSVTAYFYQGENGLPGFIPNENLSSRLRQQNIYSALKWEKSWVSWFSSHHLINLAQLQMKYMAPPDPVARHTNYMASCLNRWQFDRLPFLLTANLDAYHERINSSQTQNHRQYRYEFALSPQWSSPGIIQSRDLLRVAGALRLIRQKNLHYSWLTSFQYSFQTDKIHHQWYINVSRNIKLPTFNDLYWNPGGNPALQNEISQEWSSGFKSLIDTTEIEFSYYYKKYTDMIQWIPLQGLVWSPVNYYKAEGYGLEAHISSRIPFLGHIDLKTDYQSMKIDYPNGTSFQVTYLPPWLIHLEHSFAYHSMTFTQSVQFTAAVFASPDNRSVLDGYWTHQLILGWNFTHFFILRLQILNLWNETVFYYANYPTPGRQIRVSTTLNF